jgi:hypothetical protein
MHSFSLAMLPDIFPGSAGYAGFAVIIMARVATMSTGVMLLLGVTDIERQLRLNFGSIILVIGFVIVVTGVL